MNEKPVRVCITGPTATGKTDTAIAVCKVIPGEIIAMDSMQIYKNMRIGTAQPAESEMLGVAHHLFAHVAPEKPYTVAEYQKDARLAASDITSRRHIPVFCGGTGLYLQAISRPLTFADAYGAQDIRAKLEQEAGEPGGPDNLYARLCTIDPLSAERLHPGNLRRVIRALEVYALSGKPMSERRTEWDATPDEDWFIFALTFPREILYDRINTRVDRMIAQGLPSEVMQLMDSGLPLEAQAMQAIGYRETRSALNGECSLSEAIDRIKQNTRRYAKRQLTWLRREQRARWIDASAFSSSKELARYLVEEIKRERPDVFT